MTSHVVGANVLGQASRDCTDCAGMLILWCLLLLNFFGNASFNSYQVQFAVKLASSKGDVVSPWPHFHPEQTVHGAVVGRLDARAGGILDRTDIALVAAPVHDPIRVGGGPLLGGGVVGVLSNVKLV